MRTMSSAKCKLQVILLCGLCGIVHCYELIILHNNDVHARVEQINKYSAECSAEQAAKDECFGGEARRMTFIREVRANYSNVLVLDAGDRFSGTLWFTTYKGAAAAHFLNKEKYDAVCLGNHEFDLGVGALEPYLKNLSVPIVDANIDVSQERSLQGTFNKSIIVEKGGVKIGIIGYITTDTAYISQPGNTVFTNEIEAVQREAKRLKELGVKILIGLSHAGYKKDKMVAAEVDEMDIIVGGHSHTFLYTGPEPSTESSEGPYPTIIKQASGRTVLVVQAYAWGKYFGFINVKFDNKLEVESWDGSPKLLDKSVPRDPVILADVEEMKAPLATMKAKIIGSTAVRLEGDSVQCRLRECNSGNLITDAMVWNHVTKKTSNDTWALASIALLNGGGIRASTEPGDIHIKERGGLMVGRVWVTVPSPLRAPFYVIDHDTVTSQSTGLYPGSLISQGQVLTVLPFRNTVDLIRINGSYLWKAFEHSVKNYDPNDRPGAFLQVSGIHVVYNLNKPPGERVVSLQALCLNCHVPTYSAVEMNADYTVLVKTFMVKGGDGYDMFKNNLNYHLELNAVLADILSTYLQESKNIFVVNEGRIKFTEDQPPVIVHRCPDAVSDTATCFGLKDSVYLILIILSFVLMH